MARQEEVREGGRSVCVCHVHRCPRLVLNQAAAKATNHLQVRHSLSPVIMPRIIMFPPICGPAGKLPANWTSTSTQHHDAVRVLRVCSTPAANLPAASSEHATSTQQKTAPVLPGGRKGSPPTARGKLLYGCGCCCCCCWGVPAAPPPPPETAPGPAPAGNPDMAGL